MNIRPKTKVKKRSRLRMMMVIASISVIFITQLVPNWASAGTKYTYSAFGNQSWCESFPTSAVTVSFWVAETDRKGFTKNQTDKDIYFDLPSGFEFVTGEGTVTYASGKDITSLDSYTITTGANGANTRIDVQLDVPLDAVCCDTLHFNNFQIRATAAGSGDLFRNGGDFTIDGSTAKPTGTESMGNLFSESPVTYTSSTVTQSNTSTLSPGTNDAEIIRMEVVAGCNSFGVTEFSFNTTGGNNTGSTNASTDISNAKVYYTGTTATFSTGTQFGSTVASPNGAFTVTGTQTLSSSGTYYFWLAYDVATGANGNDTLDAQCTAIIADGSSRTPTVTAPVGYREIVSYFSRISGNWSDAATWSTVSCGGAAATSAPGNGADVVICTGNIVTLTGNTTCNNIVINSGATVDDNGAGTLTVDGNLNLNGTYTGSKQLKLQGTNTTIEGSGTCSTTDKTLFNTGNKTVLSGTNLTFSGADVSFDNGITFTNNGTLNFSFDMLSAMGVPTYVNAANATLNVAGVLLATGTFTASATGNTVNYNGSGNQNVKAASSSYYNLTLSTGGTKTLTANTDVDNDLTINAALDASVINYNLNVGRDWTNTSTFTERTGTVTFDGSALQRIINSAGETFYNLTMNKSSNDLQLNDVITVSNNLTLTDGNIDDNGNQITGNASGTLTAASGVFLKLGNASNATLFPTAFTNANITLNSASTVQYKSGIAQSISATPDYGNFTSTADGDRTLPSSVVKIAGTFTPGSNSYTITGNTIEYNGSGSQAVTAFNYNNLASSSTGARTLPSSGTVRIAGTFTTGTNTYTNTGSTIEFNGTGSQTISAFDYNNLTSSASGARVLASSGTVGIEGTFTAGSNSYTNTGSTVEFKGSGSQTIPAISYNNLTSSSTGARVLASSGTIGVASTFTKGTNTYTVTGSTIDYNGSGAQTVTDFGYNNLNAAGSDVTLGATTTLLGGITIGGTFKLGGFTANLPGDLTNNGTFTHENGKIVLNGSSAQLIGGSSATTFYDLETNNSSGITLNNAITVTNALTLTSGKIATTSTNLLTFDVSATVSGGSSSNFINGPAAKNTNSTTAFTFPTGKNTTYMSLGIEPNNTDATTFTAEFFDDTSSTAIPYSVGAGLNRVSGVEHYVLDRSGTADSKVTIYWDSDSKVRPSYMGDLRVAHWNGTLWEDKGNSATTGDSTSGSVTSTTYVTTFSPFSLGSFTSNNLLPVELLYFKANVVNTYVELIWATATEINNDFFTIERSLDGVDFEEIAEVYGAGNTSTSQYYSLVDENPYQGISYYRLKQTDYDGKFEYFDYRAVYVSNEDEFDLVSTIINPSTNEVTINLIAPENDVISIKVYSYTGKRVHVEQFPTTKGLNQLKLNLNGFTNGLYFIHIENETGMVIKSKFVKTISY